MPELKTLSPQNCSTCGEALVADAPEGLCPCCLLRQAIADGDGKGPEPPGPEPGTRLGDYELLEEIGRGGMGVVYRARQRSLDRIVAVKILPGGLWAPEERIGRFHTEARAAARIQHPNIVAIHEVGEHEGHPFFSMDYVEGESLDAAVKRGPANPRFAAKLVRTLANAVQVAHEQGILHRDLKPSNILLNAEGVPHVSDFGLAKILGAEVDPTTLTGAALGTPGYMAPEQVRSRVGAGTNGDGTAVDVYSLGAILHALLSGHAPFAAENPLATMLEVLGSEPEPLRRKEPSVPRDLETICLKCLDKDPERRYPSARELAEDLHRFLSGHPIAARPVGRPERFVRWCRRRPRTASAVLVVIAAAALTRPWQPPESFVVQTLVNEARAKRLAGDLDGALEAVAEAVRKEDSDDTRFEAVNVVTTPGIRRVRQFLFGVGHVWEADLSSDRRYLAVSGRSSIPFSNLSGKKVPNPGEYLSIKAWDLSTGFPLNRRQVYFSMGLEGFLPGKASILVQNDADYYAIWDPVENKSFAACPYRPGFPQISPDGRWIAFTGDSVRPWICLLDHLKAEELPIAGDLVGSLDGRELFVIGWDNKRLQVWDLETEAARPIPVDLPFFGITDDARFVLFQEPQERPLLRVWDLRDHRWVASIPDVPANPDQWILSRGGKRLVLGSTEDPRGIRIWDLSAPNRGPRRWPIAANREVSLHDAAFSPGGTLLAVAGSFRSAGYTIWIWDLENGREIAEVEGQNIPMWLNDDFLITAGDCNAPTEVSDFEEYGKDLDGKIASSGNSWRGATLWQVYRPIVTRQVPNYISHISFRPDGTQMAANGTVWDFEIDGGPVLRRSLELPKDETAAFDPLGRLWSVKTHFSKEGRLSNPLMRLRRIDGENDIVDLKHPWWPNGWLGRTRVWNRVFDPDGATVLVVLGMQGSASQVWLGRWELSSGRQVPLWRDNPTSYKMLLALSGAPPWPELSRDGVWLATSDGLYDTRNGDRIWQSGSGSDFRHSSGFHFSPDGTRLLFGCGRDLYVFDVTERRERHHWFGSRLGYHTPLSGLSLSADGKLLAMWSGSEEVGGVVEAETGKKLLRWRPHTSRVTKLAFHPGGRFLVSGSSRGELKLWDLEALRRDLSEVGLGW